MDEDMQIRELLSKYYYLIPKEEQESEISDPELPINELIKQMQKKYPGIRAKLEQLQYLISDYLNGETEQMI